ncbi:unnamed protein product [Protopolystoma xenopodis]|uniref:Uncharacterized protein n=1 Tax=Protopolystoma xenopodis TaxID=117903 RepID=A0A448WCA8_9PLAT|nr:unnamed protein product [Protopolystoma xenopodis]
MQQAFHIAFPRLRIHPLVGCANSQSSCQGLTHALGRWTNHFLQNLPEAFPSDLAKPSKANQKPITKLDEVFNGKSYRFKPASTELLLRHADMSPRLLFRVKPIKPGTSRTRSSTLQIRAEAKQEFSHLAPGRNDDHFSAPRDSIIARFSDLVGGSASTGGTICTTSRRLTSPRASSQQDRFPAWHLCAAHHQLLYILTNLDEVPLDF